MKTHVATIMLLTLASQNPAFAGHLNQPAHLAFAANGQLYVVNEGSHTIASFKTDGTFMGSFSTGGQRPTHLAIDDNQDLFVGTSGPDVEVYSLSGQLLKTVHRASGYALAVDAYDDIISTIGSSAQVFNEDGLKADTYATDKQGLSFVGGTGTIVGSTLYMATGPSGPGTVATYNVGNFLTRDPHEILQFPNPGASQPTQLAVDPGGNIYIAGLSSTLVKYSPTGTVLGSVNLPVPAVGVAVDQSGNIYLSEYDLNEIFVYNGALQQVGTID